MEKNGEIVISSKNLKHNFLEIKRSCGGKKICLMIKANAYGHGMIKIYDLMKGMVEFFGVSNISEAMEIKHHDPFANVLIVGKTSRFDLCINNGISFVVDSKRHFDALVKYIDENGSFFPAKIHIKINSGMNRLGIKKRETYRYIFECCEKRNIIVEGISTHFATAGNDSEFFRQQVKKFNEYICEIPKRHLPIIHVGGSGVLGEKSLELEYDMLRVGIAMYGYGAKNVKPVLSLKSKIIKTTKISAGEYVGYSKGFCAENDMRIGVVPLGYGDGISRRLSNNFSVKINGKLCPAVGNICMDMFFVDISDVEVKESDEVVVFWDAKKWAQILGTIPYEILTNMSLVR